MGIFRFRRQDSGFLVEKRKRFCGLKQVFNLYDCEFDICLVKFWSWIGGFGYFGCCLFDLEGRKLTHCIVGYNPTD